MFIVMQSIAAQAVAEARSRCCNLRDAIGSQSVFAGIHQLLPRHLGTRPVLEMATCAAPTMAFVHAHTARRLQFSASSDGLLLWLSKECWCRGLIRLAGLLDDLLNERQAEQPEPAQDPELEPLLPF
jgi:hypothetical protein